MTTEQIEYFLDANRSNSNRPSLVFFKKRNTFEGIFIQAADYAELKKKNFWRIVAATRIDEYRQSKDINLSRIFNGSEFTKLAVATLEKHT
ncbi:MAG TPA: hypothetical protein VNV35_12055 [Puia sp.]|jgi:hypothetical protein|nr:hypothetical protein [Puia sp.]